MPPLFSPRFFSFLSHLFYVLYGLFSCHLNRPGTMGCMRLSSRGRMRPLLPMPCLTLINEGADTGRICESQGEIRGPEGTPRRRAGDGRRRPPPALHAQWERAGGKRSAAATGAEGQAADGSSKNRVPGGGPRPPSARCRDSERPPRCWGPRRATHLPAPTLPHTRGGRGAGPGWPLEGGTADPADGSAPRRRRILFPHVARRYLPGQGRVWFLPPPPLLCPSCPPWLTPLLTSCWEQERAPSHVPGAARGLSLQGSRLTIRVDQGR